MPKNPTKTTFLHALLPVLVLLLCILYGLILRPQVWGQEAIPLEIVFLMAATYAVAQLMWMGHSWKDIQASVVKKLSQAMPGLLILFAIGLIIGSWMVCGTIPMLVYFGIKGIHPSFIYIVAFAVPIIFSMLTGTSWGSVGTVGVVIIGVAASIQADLGITAGAIIGGAYFGDKLSPLSDTTNMAALAVEVDLYDHIRSMMYTTLPSAIIAAIIFFVMGFVSPPRIGTHDLSEVATTLTAIDASFNFNLLLLLPPAVVLYGSIRKKATLPTLTVSILLAAVLALLLQDFQGVDVVQSLYKGFHTDMIQWVATIPENVQELFNRGGLYELSEPIVIAIMVFIFVGAIDHIQAMPIIVDRVFNFAKTRASVILSSLLATGITNALTSNQYATSFIVGDAFKSAYDKQKISRKVLSRSLEDAGTMIESLIPWTTTTVFMVATLGVAYGDYWHWQLISLINLVVAPMLAILGIGCFYEKER